MGTYFFFFFFTFFLHFLRSPACIFGAIWLFFLHQCKHMINKFWFERKKFRIFFLGTLFYKKKSKTKNNLKIGLEFFFLFFSSKIKSIIHFCLPKKNSWKLLKKWRLETPLNFVISVIRLWNNDILEKCRGGFTSSFFKQFSRFFACMPKSSNIFVFCQKKIIYFFCLHLF